MIPTFKHESSLRTRLGMTYGGKSPFDDAPAADLVGRQVIFRGEVRTIVAAEAKHAGKPVMRQDDVWFMFDIPRRMVVTHEYVDGEVRPISKQQKAPPAEAEG